MIVNKYVCLLIKCFEIEIFLIQTYLQLYV